MAAAFDTVEKLTATRLTCFTSSELDYAAYVSQPSTSCTDARGPGPCPVPQIIYAGLMDGREGDDHQSSGAHFDPRSPTPAGYPNYGAPTPTKAAPPARATTAIRQGGTPVSPTPGAAPWTPAQGTQYVASPEPGMTYSPGGVTSHTVAYAQDAQGPGANV